MASANWHAMANAQVTDFCGVNQLPGDLVYPRMGPGVKFGEGALVFSGVMERQATTVPLDMSHGGTVNFHLKFAPVVDNEDAVQCKTAFGGHMYLQYSIDLGDTWVKFGSYIVHNYRHQHFTAVEEELPRGGYSNQTMIMWDQPYFEDKRDYWALDDIVIFHRFEGNWREGEKYLTAKEVVWDDIQKAQCCFETELCESDPSTLTKEDCEDVFGWDGTNHYILRGADAYIIVASLLALTKFLYNFAVLMLTNGDVVVDKFVKKYLPRACRKRKKAAMFDFQQRPDEEPPPGMLAEGAFQCVCHPHFRRFVAIVFMFPWVVSFIWMVSVTNGYQVYQPFVSFDNQASPEESTYMDRPPYVEPNNEMDVSSGFVVFLCMSMDFANIFDMFCLTIAL